MEFWKTIQFMALFMIMLVVSLPLTTSFALADIGKISDVTVKGKAGIADFVSNEDSLEISLNAEITGADDLPKTVLPSNLLFLIGGSTTNLQFSSCEPGFGNDYNCSYIGPLQNWESGKYDLAIRLYDSTSVRQRLDLSKKTLYSDNNNPVFLYLDIPAAANLESFTVSYTVKDSACDDCAGKCIGIDRVELGINGKYPTYSGSSISVGVNGGINSYGSGCIKSGTFNISASILDLNEGTNEICARAYDNGGLFVEQCSSIFVDYMPPEFVPSSFLSLNKYGNGITYSSSAGIIGDLFINISDSGSGISSENVYANLSLLNFEKLDYDKMPASSCTQNDDKTYLCIWNDIEIKSNGAMCITILVIDDSGNENIYSKDLNLPLDSDKPVVSEITTANGNYLNRFNNTIIVKIDESGSGMKNKDAYLNLAALQSSYGIKKQADACKNIDGSWECYWYDISVLSSSASKLTVKVTGLYDDSGLSYKLSGSTTSKAFILDSDLPAVNSYTILPLGTDIETIAVGDVISIIANITEKTSEILASNVFIDFSAFDESGTLTPADSCTRESDSSVYYICAWEYAGPLIGKKTVSVKMTIADIAGNSVTKSKSIFIAGKVDKVVDNWADFAVVAKQPRLNPNFIWQSKSGTAIRAEVSLVSNGGNSYVHAFKINECKGRVITGSATNAAKAKANNESFSIISQSYFPGVAKDSKLFIFNIPNYDKNQIKDAVNIDVFCNGEIVQAASEKGDIYIPNEKVNLTFEIPLMTGSFFTQPEFTTVNKIHEKREDIEKIDKVLDLINSITKWLDPICTAMTTVRSIISNICLLLKGLKLIFPALYADDSCPLQSRYLEELWWGGKDALNAANRPIFGGGSTGVYSRKTMKSIGYWCDLVVCEECNNIWSGFDWTQSANKKLGGLFPADTSTLPINPESKAYEGGDIAKAGGGLIAPSLYFDPTSSLIVAIWCSPPCLKGIQNKLTAYKQIVVTYNVCLNTAAVRGRDTSECDTYYSSQVCQQILGEFWSVISNFMTTYITKAIIYLAENYIFDTPICNQKIINKEYELLCIPTILYHIAGWWFTLSDTIQKVEDLGELDFNGESETDVQTMIDKEMELTDEQFKKKYGTYPKYG